jgi:RNA polymerase sigma factor (sigma-70 family)
MASTRAATVLRHLRQLAADGTGALPDGQLLQQFLTRHEEAAFAALVRRHGPLVWGVCRRVLRCEQDAEDAFQATFLTLARQAAAVGRRGSVGGWLYRVAFHTAVKAKARRAARQRHESCCEVRPVPDPLAEFTGRDLLAALDEELQRLPERYRLPLVFCYLEGRTRDEAAGQLGWPLGTLKRRLEEGRARLRSRLARRGLALPGLLLAAGLAQGAGSATVPAALSGATVRTVLRAATGAGGAPAAVADLARGTVAGLSLSRLRAGAALLVAAAALAFGAGLWTRASRAEKPAAEAADQAQAPPDRPMDKPDPPEGTRPAAAEPQVVVTGRVLDAQGRPVAGAEVGVLAQSPYPYKVTFHWHSYGPAAPPFPAGASPHSNKDQPLNFNRLPEHLLARAKTDGEGRYRLTFGRAALKEQASSPPRLTVVGAGPGHALGWEGVEAKGDRVEADLRLPAEEPVRGRLFDLQGQPAAGVQVHIVRVARVADGRLSGVQFIEQVGALPFWPAPATTDDQGRFTLRGLNRQLAVTARVHSDRFALHDLRLGAGQKEEATAALVPPRFIEGRVVQEDTRRPVPNLVVRVVAHPKAEHHNTFLAVRTDRDGRFRVNHYPADHYDLRTDDLEGEPYFAINLFSLDWPRATAVKATVELALPRGVVQRGKVVDAVTGRPVAGARLLYLPKLYDNPLIKDPDELWVRQVGRALTRDDGTFQIAVLPGPGHLAVHGPPEREFVRRGLDRQTLFGRDEGGSEWRAHDFIRLDVSADTPPAEVVSKLRPGVRLPGRLVGPDGKPVAPAQMVILSHDDEQHLQSLIEPIEVQDGRFEVRSWDPQVTCRVLFLDAANGLGTAASLDGKGEGGPATVRLQPCGSATVRFVDPQGKPLVKYQPTLWVTGRIRPDDPDSPRFRSPAPNDRDALEADAEGRCTFTRLIPGASYALSVSGGKEVKQFTAESGKRPDLGDVVVAPAK